MPCPHDAPLPATAPPYTEASAAPTNRTVALVIGLTLLAFGPVLAGYLVAEGFYFVPRLLEVPFSDTLRAKWLLQPAADDPERGFQFYRPLAYMWFHAKVLLWRGWLPGLRVDHLLLNVVWGLSVGRLAWGWTRSQNVAGMAALFATVGPGHMRFMPTIYGHNMLLPAIASVWTLMWLQTGIESRRVRPYVYAVTACLAGLLCYEQVAVVPVLAVVIAAVLLGGAPRRYVPAAMVAVALSAAFLWFRLAVFGGLGGYATLTGETWIAVDSIAALWRQFWQAQVAALMSLTSPLHPPIARMPAVLSWLICGAWLAACATVWRRSPDRRRAMLSCALWIGGTTVPVMAALHAPTGWGHYVFFGSMGSAVLLAIIVESLAPVRVRPAVVTLLLAVYVGTSWAGLRLWRLAWQDTRAFVTQLREHVPEPRTPAIVYVRSVPGPRAVGLLPFLAPQDQDAYTGYLPARLFVRALPVAWPNALPYRGDRAWPAPDELHLVWLEWDGAARMLHPLADMPIPARGRAATWSLTTAAGQRLWRPAFQLRQVEMVDDAPVFVTEGNVPLLRGPALPASLGTPVYADVRMRVAARGGGEGIAEWHWRTAASPELSPQHVVRFWIVQDGQERTYRVPLVHNPNLLRDGVPTRLDLRPTGTAGATVQVISIHLIPRTPTPETAS